MWIPREHENFIKATVFVLGLYSNGQVAIISYI